MDRKHGASKVIWLLLLLVILAAAGAAAAWRITPGMAQPELGEGDVILRVEDDGVVLLTWPETAPISRVSIRSGDEKDARVLRELTGNSLSLDGSLLDQTLHIEIQAAAYGKNLLGMEREVLSNGSISVTVRPFDGSVPTLTEESGEEPGELRLRWDGQETYELGVLEDGGFQLLQVVDGGAASLRFAGDGDLPLPGYDDPVWLTLRAVCKGDGYVLYGPFCKAVEAKREMLLGSDLALDLRELGDRLYELRWNETGGDHYEVQEWSAARERWEALAQVGRDSELRYETGLLRSGSDHRYRVVCVGGGAEEPVESAEVSLRADISTRYATVWPVIGVDLFEDAGLAKSLGAVPAGTALCVLDEQGDAFQVRYKDQYGWVDSRFCMINLPEYVGDICAYDITNSYRSIFMVHDNPIRYITGGVVKGFEGVRTAEDGFLVPYLYPCAKKLLTAAQAAERDGYRLRIYEAFRPNEATRFLYDTTQAQLNAPLPTIDEETGGYVFHEPPPEPEPSTDPEEEPAGPESPDAAPALPDAPAEDGGEPTLPPEDEAGEPEAPVELLSEGAGIPEDDEAVSQPEEAAPPEDGETVSQPEEAPNAVPFTGPTFWQVMTDNGRWRLGSFLAASVSAHNRGIALDLTIEYLDGRPLKMQSAMHDLSWYSATSQNNENARLLASYMTMPGVEMRGLTSEWWHFQDDETRDAIQLSSYLYKGVTAEGWTRDNVGWRYRDAQGNYLRGATRNVDGRQYTFDELGYAME